MHMGELYDGCRFEALLDCLQNDNHTTLDVMFAESHKNNEDLK